ncbi:shikimate dehydrogenase family protein [Streptomyces acidicola]|uniref:shikimate dehydrogenase family protein n=1 Tax=Streptomyces acidicola TaxID=2596892 RepID=UPI001883A432|nr:shikimate dehydrogenase [Streptomyces acidicola]
MDTAHPAGGGAGPWRSAVPGRPLAASVSFLLHTLAYALLGPDRHCTALECREEEVPGLLGALDGSWAGLCPTSPLKTAAFEAADTVTGVARDTGAADTPVFSDGAVTAYDTGVLGFAAAPGEAMRPDTESVLLLEEGAAACPALMALHVLGPPSAQVAVRGTSGVRRLHEAAERIGIGIRVHAPGSTQSPRTDPVISTLPGNAVAPAHCLACPGVAAVDTLCGSAPLARAVTRAGGRAADGLPVMVAQAAAQVRLLTGQGVPLEEIMPTLGRAALQGTHRADGPADALVTE